MYMLCTYDYGIMVGGRAWCGMVVSAVWIRCHGARRPCEHVLPLLKPTAMATALPCLHPVQAGPKPLIAARQRLDHFIRSCKRSAADASCGSPRPPSAHWLPSMADRVVFAWPSCVQSPCHSPACCRWWHAHPQTLPAPAQIPSRPRSSAYRPWDLGLLARQLRQEMLLCAALPRCFGILPAAVTVTRRRPLQCAVAVQPEASEAPGYKCRGSSSSGNSSRSDRADKAKSVARPPFCFAAPAAPEHAAGGRSQGCE